MSLFYVYAHFLPGQSVPFYIGKGSGNRAFTRHNRSRIWEAFCKSNFEVKILEYNLSEEAAFELETQKISELKKSGIFIVNVYDRARRPPSRKGAQFTPRQKERLAEAHRGQVPWNKGKRHLNATKPVLCVELNKVFPSGTDAEREFNLSKGCISKAVVGKNRTAAGYTWRFV